MDKLKSAWKNMSKFEQAMVSIRDMGCFCAVITALLKLFGLIPYGAMAAVLLPVVALAQAALSWRRSKATALFFLGFIIFFFFVFFLSRN